MPEATGVFMVLILRQLIIITCLVLTPMLVRPHTAQASLIEAGLAAVDYTEYKASIYSSERWDTFVKKGMEAFHGDDYDSAQSLLYKAFNMGCESPIVLFQLALLNENKGNFYSALEYYQMAKKGFSKANKDHRYNKTFNENYGRALYLSGKKEEALPLLKNASKKTNSYWLLKLMGLISYEQGDTLNAVSYLERAVRIESAEVTSSELIFVYGLLGKLFLHKGETDGAYRYYKKVLELDPNNSEAKQQVGNIERIYNQQKIYKLMEEVQDW